MIVVLKVNLYRENGRSVWAWTIIESMLRVNQRKISEWRSKVVKKTFENDANVLKSKAVWKWLEIMSGLEPTSDQRMAKFQNFPKRRMIKNVQEIKIEISRCASKRKCEQKLEDQVKTVLAGMCKTKASHMKNWIERKNLLPLGSELFSQKW